MKKTRSTFVPGTYEFELAIAQLAWPDIQPSREAAIHWILLGAGWGSRIAWTKNGQLGQFDLTAVEIEKPFRVWLKGKTQAEFEKRLHKVKAEAVEKEVKRHETYYNERMQRLEKDRELDPAAYARRSKYLKDDMIEAIAEERAKSGTRMPTLYIWGGCPAEVFPPNIQPDWVEGIREAIKLAESLKSDAEHEKINSTNLTKIKAALAAHEEKHEARSES